MGITEVVTAPRSPWQNAYVERVIGSIRRECLDPLIFNERHLRRALSSYLHYYRSRPHLSLDKDCPESRPIQPPGSGKLIAIPRLGGLHHHYDRSPPDAYRRPPSFGQSPSSRRSGRECSFLRIALFSCHSEADAAMP